MNNKILEYLHLFRIKKSISDFKVSLLRINILLVIAILILIVIESLFYLQPENRFPLVLYFISIYLILIFYSGMKYFFNYYNLFNNSSNESIAELIGDKFSIIKDRLLNAYQLESMLNKNNKIEYELSTYAINKIKDELNALVISFNLERIRFLSKRFYIFLAFSIASIVLFNNYTFPSIIRLLNPQKSFEIALPFELQNITPNNLIFDGNDKKVSIAAIGEIPDSIILNYIIDDKISNIKINHNDQIFNYTFSNVQSDIIWWANVYAKSFFSSWDNIKSQIDTMVVIKRPIISNLTFNIIPPLYTGLSEYEHPANMSNISFPSGSNIIISGKSNKSLSYSGLIIDDDTLFFDVIDKTFKGELLLDQSSEGSIICVDNIFNQTSTPISYNFNSNYDFSPVLSIIQPEHQFELDESNIINLEIQLSDDYGISKLWIEYIIHKPSYIESIDTNKYIYQIKEFSSEAKIQNISHKWNIGNINISPEDEIHFTINVADNNIFSPNIIKSKKFIGRYPTIEDLFKQMEDYEEDIQDYNEELISDVDDVQDRLKDIQLDLLKADELGWDEKQELDKTIEEMEEIFNQIEEIQEVIEKVQEEAEKNNLISDELMSKYEEFQNLLTEILTPELLDAMEKIQQLSNSTDLNELLNELNNFEDSLNDFEEQIDRFIDMFDQAIAEQKIDEVVKKLESMLNQQIEVLNELDKIDPNLKDMSSKERRIEEEYKDLQNSMEDAMNSSEKSSSSTSEMFENLISSELNEETKKNIKEVRESLSKEEKENSRKEAEKAQENLSEMLEKAKQIQENFQEQTVNEMINQFLGVVNSILNISKYQDELSLFSNGVRSNSPILPTIAKKQDRIRLQNQQLMSQILLLSRKTFYITPPIIRSLGKSSLAMDKSIGYLEQKKSSQALKEQFKIIDGLNETAYLLLSSMEEMMSSGSASGFESFMEGLEQLSNEQKGINEGTMQLPQLGMNGQQSMMQQLMEQQKALKEGLEQLLSGMPGADNTGLGQANKEMEEVIDDFRRDKVDRITKEKQQRILSRMLDSQKSLTKKDFSNNRKSEVYSDNILYNSPSGLPLDKGERDLLLINAMETALQEHHPNEYQELIKLYFYNLQKNKND